MTVLLPRDSSLPRYQVLATAIQNRIFEGHYPAGQKLPTEKVLSEEFDVSTMTVRQGIGLLVRKGLIVRQQGRGTFVRGGMLAKANIALFFGPNLSNETAHFYRALLKHLGEAIRQREWAFRSYDQLNPEVNGASVISAQLESWRVDHENSPFSGFVEIAPPAESAIPEEGRHLPTVTSSLRESTVSVDLAHFGKETVRQLALRKAKRIVFFMTRWAYEFRSKSIAAMINEAKLLSLPEPIIHIEEHVNEGYAQEKSVFLKFQKLVSEWEREGTMPDGIIFNDDIALRAATPVLYASQMSRKEKLHIASLCNETIRFHHPLPVIRYEISPRKIAETLLVQLDRKMVGMPVQPVLLKGAVAYED